ncbi:ADL267Wp [Eremothecium gossypii ATCC 10895]|uniref:ADL267Wp n=1 Tax=Eremothecium gossypii (strain ATCC 10895 / CBS 109.51 / FGSC 9923 / NRRL Y-1056) TaxID=284811 RepID=Q75B44_EREGS|nr:ADL267Wp [Eremothecium gossypii ATCC 10895]AAS51653.2 ADL267Wp [Eremothecium gossypii ATCC 10895]AEY95949.1 FADL267Wp [Eremothecium gossypii FDAG1]
MSSRSNVKRPDSSVRDRKLEPLYAQLKKVDQEVTAVRKQIDEMQVGEGSQESKQKLHEQLKEIIRAQSDLKGKRQQIHDRIKQLDAQIKRKTGEVAERVGRKSAYSSGEEIRERLAQIDEEISSGGLSLVEEKLRVKEMQALNKLAKDLQQVEPVKRSIEEDRAAIAELKAKLNSLNPKEVSAQFESTQAKLNQLQSKNQVVYDQRSRLFTKRSALYSKRDEIFAQIKKIRGDFDNEFKAYKKKLDDDRIKREEEERISRVLEDKEEKMGKLQEKLIHAHKPAFAYEISAIETALFSLDPTFVKPATNTIDFPGSQPAKPIKKVEADDLVPIVKKREEFFPSSAVSKNKKKQASAAAAAAGNGKFSLEPTLIVVLADLDVSVPMTKDDVPATVDQLKAKYEDFLARQDEQTSKNVAEAEAALDKLELEYKAKEDQVRKELEEKRAKDQAAKEASASQ